MPGILIVSSQEKTTAALASLFKNGGEGPVACVSSGGEARRKMVAGEYDLLLVNAPLQDEFGDELACTAVGKGACCAILVVRAETAEQLAEKVAEAGVMVLSKPISREMLRQTVRLAAVTRQRLAKLQKENARLQARLEETRLVGRAKCALVQYKGLTEAEAHRYIEREAMDNRMTRREAATEVLAVFETA